MPYTGPEPARRPLSSDDITDGIISTADLADSAVTTAKLANNGVTAAKVSSDVSQLGKSLIQNGAMTIAQRGTSEASVFGSASGYGAWPDGFRSERSSGSESGRATFSQDSSGPVGFANCLKVLETTSDASPSAGDYYRVVTRIEAQNLQRLAYGNAAAKSITLSFYVFCNLTGAFTVTFGQNDTTRMYSTTYTVNSTNTWEKKTITIPGDASGVINDDTGIGMEIGWMLGSGSNFQGGTQGSWAANNNNMLGAGMTNNVLGSSAGDWRITGVQLEVGSVATDFEHEDISTTLAKCQRYFYRQNVANQRLFFGGYDTSSGNGVGGLIPFPVNMRAAPSASPTGTYNIVRGGALVTTGVSIVPIYLGSQAFVPSWTSSGNITQDNWYGADASSGVYIDFSAEL